MIFGVLLGLAAGLATFGLVAAAFVGPAMPLAAAVLVAAVVTGTILAKVRPALTTG